MGVCSSNLSILSPASDIFILAMVIIYTLLCSYAIHLLNKYLTKICSYAMIFLCKFTSYCIIFNKVILCKHEKRGHRTSAKGFRTSRTAL